MGQDIYSKLGSIPTGLAQAGLIEGCLVLEGGAFRGMYTQGALDAWMQRGVNFSCTLGVSAGALGGVSYVSGQIGRSARANLGHRHDKAYIGTRALRKSKSLIRLDFLLSDYNEIEPLDTQRFNDPRRRFLAEATDCRTGESVFWERGQCDIFAAVKASASMPFVTPMVDVNGVPCLDGGCSCGIPFDWALGQGYDKIVVIRTRHRSYRKPPQRTKYRRGCLPPLAGVCPERGPDSYGLQRSVRPAGGAGAVRQSFCTGPGAAHYRVPGGRKHGKAGRPLLAGLHGGPEQPSGPVQVPGAAAVTAYSRPSTQKLCSILSIALSAHRLGPSGGPFLVPPRKGERMRSKGGAVGKAALP